MSVTAESTGTARDPRLEGLRVLVVGLGRSGLAAARLALGKGALVTVADDKSESELGDTARELRRLGAELRAGGTPPELAAEADIVVVSPGVPLEIELLRAARALARPVWGETELAARYCHGRVIAVTGSNGKSTVTTMIGEILGRAGESAGVGGNLGTPLSDLLRERTDGVFVLELSSFQLETLQSLRPEIALVLNISPDHLDRHSSFEDYVRAKMRLLELQSADGAAVLNADDPTSATLGPAVRGRLYRFSTRNEVESGAFLRGDRLILRTAGGDEELLDRVELPLPGEHNVANALAASLAARLHGCTPLEIADGLRSYTPLPHRLERVATVRGVAFYNDSKATNPAAAARALAAFDRGRVHLILGGREKGATWDDLLRLIERHARRVLLVGEAAAGLKKRLAGVLPLVDCDTIPRAVAVGFAGADAGDVILLAPGCASFDQYRNFEARGEDFRRAVCALTREEGRDA